MKERMHAADCGLPNESRSVGSNKLPWIQFLFQPLNGLAEDVRSIRCVNDDVFIRCFYPDDFVNGYEQDALVISDRKPREPLALAGGWDGGVEPPHGSFH